MYYKRSNKGGNLMSETLNNNGGEYQGGNDPAEAMAGAPAYDPEAAEAAKKEYMANHHDAVEDVVKAEEMARAEDPYRTEAIKYKEAAKKLMYGGVPNTKEYEDLAGPAKELIRSANEKVGPLGGDEDLAVVVAAREKIDDAKKGAEEAADRAAYKYDASKELDDMTKIQ